MEFPTPRPSEAFFHWRSPGILAGRPRHFHSGGRLAGDLIVDKHAAREWRARLRHVLNTVWDPIGGCPDDEYDGYAGAVARLVREGATDTAIAEYLDWASMENMQLGKPNPNGRRRPSQPSGR
jgi:hypothetical protein